jgi:hypothetical protein
MQSLTQIGYLFFVLQNFRRAIKFQTTSWSIIELFFNLAKHGFVA